MSHSDGPSERRPTKLDQLAELGQGIWLDYIRRSFVESGELQAWIDRGLRGVTSNPSIFDKAIAGSADYDKDLEELAAEAKSIDQIYEALVLEDIANASDLLRPVYERTDGLDGYVSLEANPKLADDTEGTLGEIRRFAKALRRPNVMFKVPSTPAGVPAIETLIAEGTNVNVTLIFSVAQYEAIAQAYLSGLEKLAASGGDLSKMASVASVFVSRVDAAVDKALDAAEQVGDGERTLKGKIAIANAKAIYGRFRELFSGERWERLEKQGARAQRVLWGSTSTKNPRYPDTLYVDSLIGPDTVNTVPPDTLQAFMDHGTVALTLEAGLEEAKEQLRRLADLGIDLGAITETLQEEGVAAFINAFENLLSSISAKRKRLLMYRRRVGRNASQLPQIEVSLGEHVDHVKAALARLEENDVISRIWDHDYTVWKPEPTEIANRLGWLHIAEHMLDNMDCVEALADDVRAEKYTHVLLLGMGGSSLAPEVLRETFGVREGYLDLDVLDSTDPGSVLGYADRLAPERTLFIVATKSGGTVETLSSFNFFYNWTAEAVGEQEAGRHFVAITDPGTRLTEIAEDYGFRTTFVNDPDIGGRYSALSYFGLVPAALVGVDLETLLNRALGETYNCVAVDCSMEGNNRAALLGVVMSELTQAGRDKLTLIASPAIASLGDWIEQLVAESTGKEGKGIVPVVGEPLGSPDVYGHDRLFVHLRLDAESSQDGAVQALENAGHPVVRVHLRDLYDVGQQFFLWEMATAVAGHGLGINPFDQPDVEAAKQLAKEMVTAYTKTGRLPAGGSAPVTAEALQQFLRQAQPDSYIALQAYIPPSPEADAALLALRTRLRDSYRLATTVGYGPRFLHSTGQLHKGDAGKGMFVQFTSDDPRDVAIPAEAGEPESSISYGVLKAAQALGDAQALRDAGRKVIRFHLGGDVAAELKRLSDTIV